MKLGWANGLRGITALALLTGAALTRAQAPPETGTANAAAEPKVVAVRIVKEDGTVLSEAPAGIAVETGKALDRGKVAESMRALYRTGNYSDLRAVTVPAESGIRLDFVARENLFFNQVRIEGLSAPPSDSSAAAAMQLTLGQTYRKSAVTEALERLKETLQRFSARAFPVSLPQSKLHCRGRRGVAGRGGESLDAHLIEKQILSRHEVQPDSALSWDRHRAQVAIIPRPVQRAHTFRDLSAVQRFPGFHRDSRGRFREDRSVFLNDSDRHDLPGRCVRRRLGARQRSSRQERECGNASQPISPAQFHAPNRSDAG